MSNRAIALDYLDAFCSGDLTAVAATLADAFSLAGPLGTFDSKRSYIDALRRNPPQAGRLDVIEALEYGDKVAVFYRYLKPGGGRLIAQLFWLQDGKISKTLLVFDSARLD